MKQQYPFRKTNKNNRFDWIGSRRQRKGQEEKNSLPDLLLQISAFYPAFPDISGYSDKFCSGIFHPEKFYSCGFHSDDLQIVAVAEHIFLQRCETCDPVEQSAEDRIESASGEDQKQRALNRSG